MGGHLAAHDFHFPTRRGGFQIIRAVFFLQQSFLWQSHHSLHVFSFLDKNSLAVSFP